MIGRKPAILKEARLFCMFAKVCRRIIEFFAPGGLDAGGPVNLQGFEYDVGERAVDASFAEFRAYSNRS